MTPQRTPLDLLKPTDDEIVALALRETDPAQARRFEPVARGRLYAVVALAVVGLAALPSCLLRLARGLVRARQGAR